MRKGHSRKNIENFYMYTVLHLMRNMYGIEHSHALPSDKTIMA